MTKLCPKCNQIKEITEYYKDSSKKDNLRHVCKECDNKRSHQYRQNKTVKEKYREIAKNWAQKPENKAASKIYSLKWRTNHPEQNLWTRSRNRAKTKNIEFAIKIEDIIIPEVCPILGIKLGPTSTSSENAPSLDRIDSSKGYIKENIQVISKRANTLKNNGTIEEFEKILTHLKNLKT